MTLGKMFAASVVAALSVSSGALGRSLTADGAADGHAPDVETSSAKCTVIAIGYSEGKNQEIVASASAAAAEYVCHGVGSEHDIASDVASAFALAVASASGECILTGDAKAHLHASANARATAEVWVNSYFDAFADATTCDTCEAWAGSWGYISKYVFLEAVAKAEVKLEVVSEAGLPTVFMAVNDFQQDVEAVVVTAFAEALAAAANYKKEEGCLAFVNAGGCIWTVGHPDEKTYCAGCSAAAFSAGAVDSIDAIATAHASAVAWTCGDSVAIADVEVTASALAEAAAAAISFAFASCSADDGGYACADASTSVSVWVKAVAEAWAGLWAGSYTCTDKCEVTIDAVVDAVGTILVDAATDAYVSLCSDGGHWTVTDLEVEINSKSLCALAEASVVAISTTDFCVAGGIVYADASSATCPDPHH